jgi:hypothetical protein
VGGGAVEKMSAESANHIELRLRDLAQLFNSMDPSPFHDRDLDQAAETFIVDWARELPAGRDFEVLIHLATLPAPDRASGVEQAVRNYFNNRLATTRLRLRQLFRLGRWSLFIGMLFLAFCLVLSGLLGRLFEGRYLETPRLVLDIAGWVMLWRPLEIFLYDWWPLWKDISLYKRLARVSVRVLPPEV